MKNRQIITDNIALVFITSMVSKNNDTFGHTVGDQILKTIVKRIKTCLESKITFLDTVAMNYINTKKYKQS